MFPSMIAACDFPISGTIIVAGVSEKLGHCSFTFRTDDHLPPETTIEEAEASPYWPKGIGQILRLPDVIHTPIPNDQVIPAHFEGFETDDEPDRVIWPLRKFLEMQRQMKMPEGISGIGGFGMLTTISGEGIQQQLLQRWPDKVGTPLHPEKIDWAQWHRNNPQPEPIAQQLSKLKRDMLARKAQKQQRVVHH